ncbi:MAG: DUF2842 domain-containing protein [Alphaproteobacteria bacterium]|nr:DUF2842 domain-containing protein [Alphaproteobacteria bacterium]
MTPSTRKLIGTLALLVFLLIYALCGMVFAIVLQVNASRVAELAYYVVAGTLWVPVAAWLISWMHKSS